MPITGTLSEFTLAELLRFLAQSNKTGLLTLTTLNHFGTNQQRHFYLWFKQGRIIAAANRLDNNGLICLIAKQGWLSQRVALKIAQVYPQDIPFGLHLKTQSVLEPAQLKSLFYVQVMQQVCRLFKLPDANFEFQEKVSLPMLEMTGLSISAIETLLVGLRLLKDWSCLIEKLPESTSVLTTNLQGKPELPLNNLEKQVWQYANQNIPIQQIAQKLNLDVEKVQKIAFSLIMIGLVKDIPFIVADKSNQSQNFSSSESYPNHQISHSFLHNLMGFLKTGTNHEQLANG